MTKETRDELIRRELREYRDEERRARAARKAAKCYGHPPNPERDSGETYYCDGRCAEVRR